MVRFRKIKKCASRHTISMHPEIDLLYPSLSYSQDCAHLTVLIKGKVTANKEDKSTSQYST